MSIFRRLTNWLRADYPGLQGAHIALLALTVLETIIERRETRA